mmetsp:Transcript_20743/g.59116  ORF Transcript_20743/g.59116 Transcript_20743/m.59116 type:complete len:317 (-) Transcript_20743:842-1792(-)
MHDEDDRIDQNVGTHVGSGNGGTLLADRIAQRSVHCGRAAGREIEIPALRRYRQHGVADGKHRRGAQDPNLAGHRRADHGGREGVLDPPARGDRAGQRQGQGPDLLGRAAQQFHRLQRHHVTVVAFRRFLRLPVRRIPHVGRRAGPHQGAARHRGCHHQIGTADRLASRAAGRRAQAGRRVPHRHGAHHGHLPAGAGGTDHHAESGAGRSHRDHHAAKDRSGGSAPHPRAARLRRAGFRRDGAAAGLRHQHRLVLPRQRLPQLRACQPRHAIREQAAEASEGAGRRRQHLRSAPLHARHHVRPVDAVRHHLLRVDP